MTNHPRRSRLHRAVIRAVVIVTLFAAGCGRRPSPGEQPLLVEVTGQVGFDDSPPSWPDGRYRIPEVSAAGLALLDFDADGHLDVYQVRHPPPDDPERPATNRLYRRGEDGRYVEVAGAAGLADPGYGNGVALGDADGDGDVDVYVANLGPDALYVNQGDGTFTDATTRSALRGEAWSTGAAFFDYDRDGDLDLYVSHYLVDDPSRVCRPQRDAPRDYCGPSKYQGVADTLYRNRGDGTFEDVSRAAGITQARPGFGVICADLTGDGWPDIYVANDMQPNQLHVNQRNGRFVDEALARGVALNGMGQAEASMGVAIGDVDGDGRLDLFVSHLVDETHTLYVRSRGEAAFSDRSASSGLGGATLPFTGWGCGLVDLDHDGDVDVPVVHGRVARGPPHPGADVGEFWKDYAEPNQLFLNQGDGRFIDSSSRSGTFASRVEVSRALALGDLDGDGDVDLVTQNIGGDLRVFRNDAPPAGSHWIRLRATTGGRDALGALLAVDAGGRRQFRPLLTSYSFASASEAVAHFGLGTAPRVDRIEVLWPDGTRERFPSQPADRCVVLRQGEGTRSR